jgi:hypothetical protein
MESAPGQKLWLLPVVTLIASSFVQCVIASSFDDDDTGWFLFGAGLFVPAGTIGAIIERRLTSSPRSGFFGALIGIALASVAFWFIFYIGWKLAGAAAAVGSH